MIIRLLLGLLLALPAMAQFAITNHATIYVSPSGNDLLAIRGRADRPWRTITNALWAMQNGDRLFMLPGNYTNSMIYTNTRTAGVKSWGKTNITIEGSGPGTVWWGLGAGTHWELSNCLNVVVKNFAIMGNKPAGSVGAWLSNGGWAAIDPRACRNLTIEGLTVKDHGNHGIVQVDDISCAASDHVTIRNCWFENIGATNGVPGVVHDGTATAPGGNYWHITDNVFTNVTRCVEPYSNVQNLRECIITRNRMVWINWEAIAVIYNFSFVGAIITDNYIEGEANAPLAAEQMGINCSGTNTVENCLIANNILRRFPLGNAIVLATATNRFNRVMNNTIEDVSFGILLSGQTTNNYLNLVGANTIKDVVLGGIVFRGIGNQIINNTLANIHHFSNGAKGIHGAADTNKWNVVKGNQIYWTDIGVQFDANCRTNEMFGNRTVGCLTAITDNGTGTITNGSNLNTQ